MAIVSSTYTTSPYNPDSVVVQQKHTDTEGDTHYRTFVTLKTVDLDALLIVDAAAMADSLAEVEANKILEGDD